MEIGVKRDREGVCEEREVERVYVRKGKETEHPER